VRLVNGLRAYAGRVEIYYNGQWGTVCDDNWSEYDARVVCRQLGYTTTNVQAYGSAYFGAGTGQVWLDGVNCVGIESSLSSCDHNPWGVNDCSHNEDAGVSCVTSSGTNDTGVSSFSFSTIGFYLGGIAAVALCCFCVFWQKKRQATTGVVLRQETPPPRVVGIVRTQITVVEMHPY
jgi:hypothetical protein